MTLASDACALTQTEAESRGIDVEVRDGSVRADIEAEQIRQVFLNVLLNAFDATAGHDKPHVVVEAATRTVGGVPFRCVGIRDNGPGLPTGSEEQIFDPYFTTKDEGTGLGLSISSRIMESHGGFIDFERADNETTAWLCFPEELR